jgi:large subunit ribosomal protein L23
MSKVMLLRPRISEKAYGLSQENTYVFNVPKDANRLGVAQAVSEQFEVTVEDVRMANSKGKVKTQYTKRRRTTGKRVDTKRAYVRLKDGDKLPIFAAEEAEEEKAKKDADKAAKKAAKEKK